MIVQNSFHFPVFLQGTFLGSLFSSGLLKSVKGHKMIDMNKNYFNTINFNKTLWDAGQIKCLKHILEIHGNVCKNKRGLESADVIYLVKKKNYYYPARYLLMSIFVCLFGKCFQLLIILVYKASINASYSYN